MLSVRGWTQEVVLIVASSFRHQDQGIHSLSLNFVAKFLSEELFIFFAISMKLTLAKIDLGPVLNRFLDFSWSNFSFILNRHDSRTFTTRCRVLIEPTQQEIL